MNRYLLVIQPSITIRYNYNTLTRKDNNMKKYVSAALVDEFLKYHEDEDNYVNNRNGFDKMYSILEKYDDSNGNDNVDVAFLKATPEDQQRMVDLIRPKKKVGQRGYAQELYYNALNDEFSRDYTDGIIDIMDALFAEGWIL